MTIKESYEGRNILRVNNYKVSKDNLKIALFEKGERVENFHQLSGKPGESKARITLKIGSGSSEHSEESKEYIEYRFLKSSFESQTEYEKAKNEAHANFLWERFTDLPNSEQKVGNDLKCVIKKEGELIALEIGNQNNSTIPKKDIRAEGVEINIEFYGRQKFDLNDIKEINSPSKIPFWKTPFVIIILLILVVIVILVIIFRKKIWKWLKGEKEFPKKPVEQIDIF